MSRPRFLADHNFRDWIVDGVLRREPAFECVRARRERVHAIDDPALLAFAAERRLIVLSHDVNTLGAAAYARVDAGLPMTGVFLSAQRGGARFVIDSLLLIWHASDAEEG